MSIITFKRGDNRFITPNFRYGEFDCKCGCPVTTHDTELSLKLQVLRNYFGKPVVPTSPYRCPSHNAKVGGGSQSYHMKGMACDFIINGVNVWEIGMIAEAIGFNGIGVYDDGYVHVDVRPESEKYFWHNSDTNKISTFGGAEIDIYSDDVDDSAEECLKEIKSVLSRYGY